MNKKFLVCGGGVLLAGLVFTTWIYSDERSKHIYQDQRVEAEKRFNSMTLDEKIGQLLFPSYALLADTVSPDGNACRAALTAENPAEKSEIIKLCGLDQIQRYHLGAVLAGGGPYFNAPTLKNWATLNALAASQHDPSHDPLLLTGSDAIHGNMHVQGAVIFPHNIGLGTTHDPELIQKMGEVVGQDSLASGFNWVFMPTVAIAHDLRWGRSYESFGQENALVKTLAHAYIEGLQDIRHSRITGVVATAKHFIGDGATKHGFDEGDDAYKGSLSDFWQANGSGYEGAVRAQVATLMVSYSAIDDQGTHNSTRMHLGGQWNILNVFKDIGVKGSGKVLYRFPGFAVSDWNGHTRAADIYNLSHPPLDFPSVFAKAINAGVDMFMLGEGETMGHFPDSGGQYTSVKDSFEAIKNAYQQGLISPDRLHDAVIRILQVKLAMKTSPLKDYALLQKEQRALALQVAKESLVLLKNDQKTLPLKKSKIQNVIFVGDTNDLGVQNGGWTVNWQGQKGDQFFIGDDQKSSGAITLEQAIKKNLPAETHYYYVNSVTQNTLPDTLNARNSIVIAVVAEAPYTEYMGDIGNAEAPDLWYDIGATNGTNKYFTLPQSQVLGLKYSDIEAQAITALKRQGVSVITVVYSGRPVILSEGGANSPLESSDVVIAAFLPGTLGGQALSDAIFGAYHFRSASKGQSNTLTFPWPENMVQVEDHFSDGALFSVGYGLGD